MTLGADCIPFGNKGTAVRLMTVGASHALPIHFTLQKRAVDVDLIIDLPISVIETWPQKCELVVIGEFAARRWRVCAHRTAPGMAACAQFDFFIGGLQWNGDSQSLLINACRLLVQEGLSVFRPLDVG